MNRRWAPVALSGALVVVAAVLGQTRRDRGVQRTTGASQRTLAPIGHRPHVCYPYDGTDAWTEQLRDVDRLNVAIGAGHAPPRPLPARGYGRGPGR